jgi:heme/copper-type cytochrome/quinol oxidase subunit 2
MCWFFFQAVIFFFVTIVFLCLLLAVSDYRQSLQFQNLNQEKQNIQLEVCIIVI